MMKGVIQFLIVVLCASALWAQGLIICKSCGREAKAGDTACSRCDTPLPQPRMAVDAPAVAAPEGGVSAELMNLAAAAVESNYRLAKEVEAAGQPSVALPYYQNAMAIMRLLPPGHFPKEVGDALLNGRVRALQAMMAGQVKCKICNGSGKYQMDQRKVDSAGTVKALSDVACPACKGKGSSPGMAEVPQAKALLLQGRAEFERRQMLAGEVRLGRAFIPAAVEKLLQNPQRALVMTGMQAPCDSCQGTTRQVCTGCRGLRWTKCTYTGCRNGEVEVKRKQGEIVSKRLNETGGAKCPQCAGLAEVMCKLCEGHASVACQKCSGSGTAARCTRCTGTGLQECSKCKGTGSVKDVPCVECGGDRVVLCATCRGEGARAK